MRAVAGIVLACVISLCAISAAAQERQDATRVVHVFVALCDNEHQGIQRAPDELGDGDDPAHNLYWGAMYGVKTVFGKSDTWKLVATVEAPSDAVLERLIFKHATADVYLVADAYKGSEIRQATLDFLAAAGGEGGQTVSVEVGSTEVSIAVGGAADLVAYIGHNGLMDFELDEGDETTDADDAAAASRDASPRRDAVVLCCMSRSYFAGRLERAGARPLLMTVGLMAPEAYTLEAALDGWIAGESPREIRLRAAKAYNEHQDCDLRAAKRLFDLDE